jgi:hypothetical protein
VHRSAPRAAGQALGEFHPAQQGIGRDPACRHIVPPGGRAGLPHRLAQLLLDRGHLHRADLGQAQRAQRRNRPLHGVLALIGRATHGSGLATSAR